MGINLDPDERDPYTRAFLKLPRRSPNSKPRPNATTREGIAASRAQGKWHGRAPFGFDVGPEGYLVPNDDYEIVIVSLDELDKDTSKRDLARRTSVARSTIQYVANNRERYISEPPESV